MREMCEQFNIKMLTTGAYSPFQNGLCEKNHHTVDLMLEKMIDSNPSIKFNHALSAAIYAINTLLNISGFSPMQITFGLQPRIPSAAQNDKPPANEDIIESVPIYKRLTALFEARKAFVDVENSLRLKKALRVKPQPMEHYSSGDKVFYKFGTDSRWHGPGTIIGTDNKVIFLRHSGNVISTSQSRIIKADIEQSGHEEVEQSQSCQESGLHNQGRKNESLKKKDININTQDNKLWLSKAPLEIPAPLWVKYHQCT